MASKPRWRILLAGALAVLLVGVILSRGRAVPDPGMGQAPAQPAVGGERRAPGQPGGVIDLDLTALEAPRTEPAETERNPFRFKAAAPRSTAPSARTADGGTAAEGASAAAPSPPPLIPLKFIGVVDAPNAGRLAVLSDDRGVYHGREGDTIEGRYRILRIGVESVELAYIDGRGRQVIRLTGQ